MMSPWPLCAERADCAMVIETHGFEVEPVAWQIVTFGLRSSPLFPEPPPLLEPELEPLLPRSSLPLELEPPPELLLEPPLLLEPEPLLMLLGVSLRRLELAELLLTALEAVRFTVW